MRILLLLSAVSLAVSTSIPWETLQKSFKQSAEPEGETYALLVAGSNGWYNYRHQADVAHSYHVLLEHGIPAENIIVMMYDDIANNNMNPYMGKLYNKPHGKDVYEGLKIDYKGKSVTPKNFLNVLAGKKNEVTGGNGRVIESTEKDRIFVFFTDHGSVGLIAFPEEVLTAKDLYAGLKNLHAAKRFSQLVFYLEACESGSMFDKILKDDMNIYAITAANGRESSWGTYCENDMKLPCLGDLFSVNWMQDSDEEDITLETLNEQYVLVKRLTNQSHVMHFGDLNIAQEPVGYFQGEKKSKNGMRRELFLEGVFDENSVEYDEDELVYTSWPARDIELNYLKQMRQYTNDVYSQKKLTKTIDEIKLNRIRMSNIVNNLVNSLIPDITTRKAMLTEYQSVLDLNCHHKVANAFDELCIDFNKYYDGLSHVYVLNNLCIELGDADIIISKMISTCPNKFVKHLRRK